MRSLLLAAGLILAAWCCPQSIQAATVTPESAQLQVGAGERVHQTVTFENDSEQVQTYQVSVSGVSFGASADDLRFEPLTAEQSAWINIDKTEFLLSPRGTQSVEVTVDVPVAQPAQTLTLAVIASAELGEQGGIGVSSGLASILFVTIGQGLQPNLSITSFGAVPASDHRLPIKFAALITNSGSGLSQPQVGVVIKNIWGHEVATLSMNPTGRRVPNDTNRVFSVDWEGSAWRLGPYTVDLYVFPDDSATVLTSSTSVVLFSWQMLGVLAVGTLALGVAVTLYLRARRR